MDLLIQLAWIPFRKPPTIPALTRPPVFRRLGEPSAFVERCPVAQESSEV